ncbi:RICIN domain-containing protein [Pelagicoccus sp. SDUM812005]|uniref:RICIN domain-containing protein n=1 Tax=Pelagicoccus sp. SDUM812005 TaxID=3041257 RepID=UPI00280FC925|nr:RICIN domain-containing protein [Pelagicoccus sp. SDUM812005]MDQ8181023.1 RICIN domain-containing protein [Pelagicoccus sp. SDUM812005]
MSLIQFSTVSGRSVFSSAKAMGVCRSALVAALLSLVPASSGEEFVFFDLSDEGVEKSIPIWGLDTAWLSESNVRRGVEFMGKDQVDVIRFSFTGDRPLIDGDLETTRQAEFDERMRIVDTYAKPDAGLYFNSDTIGIDPYFMDGSSGPRPDRWAELIDITRQKAEEAGRTVLSVAPFNEPDLLSNGQGSVSRLREILALLREDPKYKDSFANIRLAGGSTLNNDEAMDWYDPLKDLLDEGNTHQLAGTFDTYASFFEYVKSNGDIGINDELHNVMEAMVGAEYGMEAGIWWGSAEYARGEFVKASDGRRLGYAENRPNWTAASVYRAPSGKVQAFVGESEREARPTSFVFVSKDRDVFYDGVGPQRRFKVNTTGGSGYRTAAHKNAERVVNVTWGEDIQPVIDGRYTLVNRATGKVLEVEGGSSQNGANLQQASPSYSDHQSWMVSRVPFTIGGDWSYFSIKPFHNSEKTGDVWNWNLDAGADVRLYDYAGGTNQQWVLEYVEDGYFYIRSRFSGKYLEVANGSVDDGANAQLGEGPGGFLQQWRFLPAGALVEFDPPEAPTGLSARANALSVSLAWDENSDADFDSYSIYRSIESEGPYELIARGISSNAFVDGSANEGSSFFYRVKAVDRSLNHSDYSEEVSASPSRGRALVLSLGFEQSMGDSSGNANDAETGYTPAFLDGRGGGKSLYFNGATQFANLPAEVSNFEGLSISCWVYWSGGSDGQRLFEFGENSESRFYLSPKVEGSGLRFAMISGGAEKQLNGATLESNRWTHLSVTLGAGVARLYVDGVLQDESDGFASPSDLGSILNVIGKSHFDSFSFYRGRIDDFRIHNFALATHEVVAEAGLSIPAAPMSVAGAFSGDEVYLTWQDVPGAKSYTVKRSETSDGPFVAIGTEVLKNGYLDEHASGSDRFYYLVTAVNEMGESLASSAHSVSLLSPGEEWRREHFGTVENEGDAADGEDPDRDGIVNILERAYGGDPRVADRSIAPYLDRSTSPLAMVYRRDSRAVDLEFRVLESSDLSPLWVEAEGSTEVLGEEGAIRWIRFQRTQGSDENLFLRLEVKKD